MPTPYTTVDPATAENAASSSNLHCEQTLSLDDQPGNHNPLYEYLAESLSRWDRRLGRSIALLNGESAPNLRNVGSGVRGDDPEIGSIDSL
jgi:hypothetical protein